MPADFESALVVRLGGKFATVIVEDTIASQTCRYAISRNIGHLCWLSDFCATLHLLFEMKKIKWHVRMACWKIKFCYFYRSAHCVCTYVRLSVHHSRLPCQNGWTYYRRATAHMTFDLWFFDLIISPPVIYDVATFTLVLIFLEWFILGLDTGQANRRSGIFQREGLGFTTTDKFCICNGSIKPW